MKKYIVIGLIVLVGGALLLGPLLNTNDPDPGVVTTGGSGVKKLPARFNMQGNLAAICNQEQTIEILVNEKEVVSLEVNFDGATLKNWENPKGNLSLTFTPSTVGTFAFDLNIVMKDGTRLQDDRSVRVVSDILPEELKATVVNRFPHNESSFTQGLEFEGGTLFEGVGLYGESRVMEVELSSGIIKRKLGLDGNYFGEGITLMNEKLYQLTWRKGKCFIYDYKGESFQIEDERSFIGEGWGLCNNGKELIMSDGTETIYFRDPESFQELRRINVYNNLGPIPQLNELEFIDGKIYANVYQTNVVVAIDPETGKVLEMIRCDDLVAQGRGMGLELNGIAQNDVNGKIYMTGKNWSSLFEVVFTPTAIP